MNKNYLTLVYDNFNKYQTLKKIKNECGKRTIIFLCVGNSKIWYDSFGPVIGSLLKMLNCGYYVYGNTQSNITAKNIKDYIEMIYKFHENPYIIVFDNAISNESNPTLKIIKGQTTCAAMSDDNIKVGNLSIIYCFNNKHLKEKNNYYEMLNEIKKVLRLIKFSFDF